MSCPSRLSRSASAATFSVAEIVSCCIRAASRAEHARAWRDGACASLHHGRNSVSWGFGVLDIWSVVIW